MDLTTEVIRIGGLSPLDLTSELEIYALPSLGELRGQQPSIGMPRGSLQNRIIQILSSKEKLEEIPLVLTPVGYAVLMLPVIEAAEKAAERHGDDFILKIIRRAEAYFTRCEAILSDRQTVWPIRLDMLRDGLLLGIRLLRLALARRFKSLGEEVRGSSALITQEGREMEASPLARDRGMVPTFSGTVTSRLSDKAPPKQMPGKKGKRGR